MELCGALKNNYFERCQVSAPLLVAGTATFHSLEDDAILTHRLSEDADSGSSQHVLVRARVDQATSLSEITSKMYLSKQDPRLMEESTLSGDLERYKRAVAAMKYYGARVGAGVGVACGDVKSRCAPRAGELRIGAALPATLPAASRLAYGPGECYYAVNGDASDSSSLDGVSRHRLSPQRLSPQRPSQQGLSPACQSPERWSPEQLSPLQRRSPNHLSPLHYPLREDHPTRRTHSSPMKYTSNQLPTERVGRSPPGRTRIPVANTSRENVGYDCRMSVKETNMAYFAPLPPANPLPVVFHSPSMCQRRDVKHSCLARGHAQARAVDGDTIRLCERTVAEAVRAGQDPSHLTIPPSVLQCIPPRRSVDSLKDKTASLRQRIDQLKSKRSDNEKNKDACKDLAKLNNILKNGTFGEQLGNLNSKTNVILCENLETLDSKKREGNSHFKSQELKNKEISNEVLGTIDSNRKDIFAGDLESQNLKCGNTSNHFKTQAPNKEEIFSDVFESQGSGSKNLLTDLSESSDSIRSEISNKCIDGAESKPSAKSKEILKLPDQSVDLNGKETFREEILENSEEGNNLSKSITHLKEAYTKHFVNQDKQMEEDYKELLAGPKKVEVSPKDLLDKIDFPSGDYGETKSCVMRQGAACWTPAVGAAGECGGSSEPEKGNLSSELKSSRAEPGKPEGTERHGSVPSDLTLKNSLSDLSSVLPVDMLAGGLLIDILRKFSSHEDLCTDLHMTKTEDTSERDGKPGEDVFTAANQLLKQRLSQLDEESCDERRDVDTSEFSGYNTTNSRDEEMLSAHLSRMARSIVEQTGEEYFIDTAPPTPKACDEWRSGKEQRDSSDRSTSTERDSIETKELPTFDGYRAEKTERAVTTDVSIKSWQSEWVPDAVMQRTTSCSKSVQVCSSHSLACFDKTQSHIVLNSHTSHREVETKVSQHPRNKERNLRLLADLKHSQRIVMVYAVHNDKTENLCSEELACVPKRSVSGRRLLADLKRSQRMLGMVDSVLNDETATSSEGTFKSARRVRSWRAVNMPSTHLANVPRDQSHCSACQAPSVGGIGGSQCMQQLQVLRNEQLRHIQRQVQQIVHLNKFIDAYR